MAVNNLLKNFGFDLEDTGFNVFKPIEQAKRPWMALSYNLLLVVLSYMMSQDFKNTNVQFCFILISGFFIYRLWSFVYSAIPKTMKPFPLFNMTSSSFMLMGLTLCNEWRSIMSLIRPQVPTKDCDSEEDFVCTEE